MCVCSCSALVPLGVRLWFVCVLSLMRYVVWSCALLCARGCVYALRCLLALFGVEPKFLCACIVCACLLVALRFIRSGKCVLLLGCHGCASFAGRRSSWLLCLVWLSLRAHMCLCVIMCVRVLVALVFCCVFKSLALLV